MKGFADFLATFCLANPVCDVNVKIVKADVCMQKEGVCLLLPILSCCKPFFGQ